MSDSRIGISFLIGISQDDARIRWPTDQMADFIDREIFFRSLRPLAIRLPLVLRLRANAECPHARCANQQLGLSSCLKRLIRCVVLNQ